MENEKSLYSLAKIKEIDDDEDFIQQVISIFLETVPENTGALVKACNEEDWEQVYFYAHKIKSNVNLLSIDCIIDEIKFVEQSAKNSVNIEMIPEKINFIDGVIRNALERLKIDFALNK
jgi:hypothetical protein